MGQRVLLIAAALASSCWGLAPAVGQTLGPLLTEGVADIERHRCLGSAMRKALSGR